MNKAELVEKAVVLGIDASGTVKQLKDRIGAYEAAPKKIEDAPVRESKARKAYRMGNHIPK